MRKLNKSNVVNGTTRNATLTFVVENGASWAINNKTLSAKWIERIENMLEELCREMEGCK